MEVHISGYRGLRFYDIPDVRRPYAQVEDRDTGAGTSAALISSPLAHDSKVSQWLFSECSFVDMRYESMMLFILDSPLSKDGFHA